MAKSTTFSAIKTSRLRFVAGSSTFTAARKASAKDRSADLPPGLPDLPFWKAIALNIILLILQYPYTALIMSMCAGHFSGSPRSKVRHTHT